MTHRSRLRNRAGVRGSSASAPSLTWDTAPSDDTPGFTVTGAFAADDIVAFEIDTANTFASSATATNTVDASEDVADSVSFVLSALDDGVYYTRARINRNSDYSDWSSTVTVTINAAAPNITSSNSVSVNENVALSHPLTSNETVTWSITGGADQAHFEISGSTLRWASNGTKNYETPNDADANNAYVVQVTANDGLNTTSQTIMVTVQDVAEAMVFARPIMSTLTLTPSGTRNNSFGISTPSAGTSTATNHHIPAGLAGTISDLVVEVDSFPGNTGTYTVTLYDDANNTGLGVTVASGGIVPLTNSTYVASPGSKLHWRVVPSGTPSVTSRILLGCKFTPSTAGKNVFYAFHAASTTTGFMALDGSSGTLGSSAEATLTQVMPCAGTITEIHALSPIAPGTGISRTYTLRKNGVDQALSVTVSVAGIVTTGTGSVSFAAGDTVCITVTNNGGTPASSSGNVVLVWEPTTSGEQPIFCLSTAAVSNTTAATYLNFNHASGGGTTTEAALAFPVPGTMAISRFRGMTDTQPGSGKSRTMTIRKDLGVLAGAPSFALANTDVTGSDLVSTASFAAGENLSVVHAPSGTPNANAWLRLSAVCVMS